MLRIAANLNMSNAELAAIGLDYQAGINAFHMQSYKSAPVPEMPKEVRKREQVRAANLRLTERRRIARSKK